MRVLLLAALVSVLAAGCLEPSVDPGDRDGRSRSRAPTSQDEQELLARAEPDDGAGAATDGYLLRAAVGPDAPLAGFAWRLPEKAAHASDFYDGDAVTLQIFPLDVPSRGVPVDATAFGLFAIRDGEAVPVHVSVDVPGYYSGHAGGQALEANFTPQLSDAEITVSSEDLADADELRIVLGAQGEQRALDVLLVVSPTDSTMEEHERATLAQALDQLQGQRILSLEQVGSGNGIWAASHVEIHWPWADLDLVMRFGAVEFDEDSLGTPAGPVLTRTTSGSMPATQGWTAGLGYETSNHFEGEWSLEGSAHDLALLDRSPTFGLQDDPALSLAGAAVGYPIYQFTADGEGGVDVTMQVRGLDTSDETFRMFTLVTFGSSLQDLVGAPGVDEYTAFGAASRWLVVGRDVLPV